MTKNRTKLYLNKLVKDLIKDYKEQELNIQKPVLFFRDHLHKELYCKHKGKRYIIKVVITAKKLPLNGFKK